MRTRRHNRQGVLNVAYPDWNEDRGTYGRGYQNHGYESNRGDQNFEYANNLGYGTSIGGRYDNHYYGPDRNYNERGGYAENQYSRDSGFNRGRRDEEYNNYDDWRSSHGRDYNRDYLNYGSERGGNDRVERIRDDYGRSDYDDRSYNRRGNFGGGSYGSDYNRNRRGFEGDERGWWDKTSDEVSSWFGDDDAERRREWDKRRSGQHRGKGPKGYSRSDERIKEDISDRLSYDIFIDASDLEVMVNNGDVTLTGIVNERRDKRRAEDIAEAVLGVRNVENRIRIGQQSSGEILESSPGESRESSRVASNNRSRVKETT